MSNPPVVLRASRISRVANPRTWPIHGFASWLGVVLVVIFILLATVGQLFGDPYQLVTESADAPSLQHWFGTDHLGRDLFARVSLGAWTSLYISLASVTIGVSLAVPLGMLAGYHHGGRLDGVIMRGLETVQALPMFVFVMFILSLAGTGNIDIGPFSFGMKARLIVCLGIAFVPYFARIARGSTLVEIQEDYVTGLQVVGVKRREILMSEISVNVMPAVLVQAFLATAIAIFAEGGLSFLGLGVSPPHPTLGNLIAEAGAQILEGYWWYSLLPGVVMVIGILGFNLLGDALNDSVLGSKSSGEKG